MEIKNNTIIEDKVANIKKAVIPKAKPRRAVAPRVKTEKEIRKETTEAYKKKNSRMIRCQFNTENIRGEKKVQLTYSLFGDKRVHKITAYDKQELSLPYGYIVLLNTNNSIKKKEVGKMKLNDNSGSAKAYSVEDDEVRYSVRVLEPMTPAELAELEPAKFSSVREI